MFGIGLPEMILIMALALIVVGPDKLPEMARSIAKGVLELKKTVSTLKEDFADDNPFDSVKPELEEVANSLKNQIGDTSGDGWDNILQESDVTLSEVTDKEDIVSAAEDETDTSLGELIDSEHSSEVETHHNPEESAEDIVSETTQPDDKQDTQDISQPEPGSGAEPETKSDSTAT